MKWKQVRILVVGLFLLCILTIYWKYFMPIYEGACSRKNRVCKHIEAENRISNELAKQMNKDVIIENPKRDPPDNFPNIVDGKTLRKNLKSIANKLALKRKRNSTDFTNADKAYWIALYVPSLLAMIPQITYNMAYNEYRDLFFDEDYKFSSHILTSSEDEILEDKFEDLQTLFIYAKSLQSAAIYGFNETSVVPFNVYNRGYNDFKTQLSIFVEADPGAADLNPPPPPPPPPPPKPKYNRRGFW